MRQFEPPMADTRFRFEPPFLGSTPKINRRNTVYAKPPKKHHPPACLPPSCLHASSPACVKLVAQGDAAADAGGMRMRMRGGCGCGGDADADAGGVRMWAGCGDGCGGDVEADAGRMRMRRRMRMREGCGCGCRGDADADAAAGPET
jgi:hypothetical protein